MGQKNFFFQFLHTIKSYYWLPGTCHLNREAKSINKFLNGFYRNILNLYSDSEASFENSLCILCYFDRNISERSPGKTSFVPKLFEMKEDGENKIEEYASMGLRNVIVNKEVIVKCLSKHFTKKDFYKQI